MDAEDLARRLDEANETIRALLAREVDAVTTTEGPLLLRSAQLALRHSETLLRAVFDGAHDAMVIADDEGRYVDANRAACTLLGLEHEELLGRRPHELSTRSVAEIDAAWARFLAEGSSAGVFELRRTDGEIRTLDFRATARILPDRHLSVLRDITEQRRAKEALRRSEERFALAFRSSPVGMLVTRASDDRVVEANEAFLAGVGATREEAIGRNFEDFGLFTEPTNRRTVRESRSPGTRWSNELIALVRPGSEPLRVLLSQEDIEFDGEPCVLTIAVDVTERERAVEERREVEERLQALVSSTPVVVFGLDQDLRFTVIEGNDTRKELLGRSALELYGDLEVTLPDGETVLGRDAVLQVVAGTPLQFEAAAAGRWYEIRLDPLRPPRRGLVGVATDVTQRHVAEAELRATNEMLRALVVASPAAIVVIGRDETVELWNPAAEKILGYPAEEVLGKRVPLPLGAALWCDLEPANATVIDAHATVTGPDGRPIELSVSRARLVAPDGTRRRCVAILVDITEQRRTEAHLVQAQKMEVVGRLAGGIAHDFNNMLAAISGFASLALWQIEPGHPVADDLSEVVAAVERARTLTGRLLLFGRRAPTERQPVDLGSLLRDFDKMMRRLVTEEIELVTDCAPGLWPVLADPAHMEQLVLNLVINARDAMPRGGVITIRSANVPAAAPRSGGGGRDRVALSVSDTGIGMAPDIAERIFEPFFTTKREGRGTGLGLSIVENIVAAHGGEVRVESAPGRGACFTVILPRADGDDRRGESQAAPAPPVGGHETVLVVDDDDLVRRAIQQVLVRHGYRVLLASNGGDALLRFEQEKERIRLLVTDVVMPQMRGSELARRVREQAPHLPVVFMSGYTEEELDGAADLHHGQLLHKPFEPHRFLTVVRELLDAASH